MKYNLKKIELKNLSILKKSFFVLGEITWSFVLFSAIIGSVFRIESKTPLYEDIIMTIITGVLFVMWTKLTRKYLKTSYLRVPGAESILTKQEIKDLVENEEFEAVEGFKEKDLMVGEHWIMMGERFFVRNMIINVYSGHASNGGGYFFIINLVNGRKVNIDISGGDKYIWKLENSLRDYLPYYEIEKKSTSGSSISRKRRKQIFEEYLAEGNTKMSIITSTNLIEREMIYK